MPLNRQHIVFVDTRSGVDLVQQLKKSDKCSEEKSLSATLGERASFLCIILETPLAPQVRLTTGAEAVSTLSFTPLYYLDADDLN